MAVGYPAGHRLWARSTQRVSPIHRNALKQITAPRQKQNTILAAHYRVFRQTEHIAAASLRLLVEALKDVKIIFSPAASPNPELEDSGQGKRGYLR